MIQGFHPFAEDGGVYLPGILKLLHPDLYPTWTGFVTAQSRFSLFAPIVATFARFSGSNFVACIFAVYCVTIWTTLFAGWQIVSRCCRRREVRIAAVTIFALCLSIPIAGTSLMLMDPYVTARSISTPCSLLSIVGVLDLLSDLSQSGQFRIQSLVICTVSLLIAVIMHPLMAAYTAGCIILLACASIASRKAKLVALISVGLSSIAVAAILNLVSSMPPAGYKAIALSRYYWFLSAWHWYEIMGLGAPLILLFALTRHSNNLNERARWLAQMAIFAGLIGIAVSVLFVHQSGRTYVVAMLQPLRIFQMVYIIMILLLGTALANSTLKRYSLSWSVLFIGLAGLMLFVQVRTFPHSSHLELPWLTPKNDWERGFVWIRNNTPVEATFALDAHYIASADEDAQNFRAIAERSSLPDYDKDGGIAAIEPDLTNEWITGEGIQTNLSMMNDSQRKSRLVDEGVGWLVLPRNSGTAFPCPYQNRSMKVCRIP